MAVELKTIPLQIKDDMPRIEAQVKKNVKILRTPRASILPTVLAVMVLLTTCLETLCDVEKERLMVSSDSSRTNDNISVAAALAREVRVLCWVMTYPKNHMTRALHVSATWGKRCNKLLFMSTEEEVFLPTIELPVTEGYTFLWGKTKAAFKYVYHHHRDDADWFLKADDDTYVVVENLRFLLSQHNTSDPIYFGAGDHVLYQRYDPENSVTTPQMVVGYAELQAVVVYENEYLHSHFGYELRPEDFHNQEMDGFNSLTECEAKFYSTSNNFVQGFMDGGAGYVLSKEALDRFVNKGLPSPRLCSDSVIGSEDVELGLCLSRIGVKGINVKDEFGYPRFITDTPQMCSAIERRNVFVKHSSTAAEPIVRCSDHAISFHRVDPEFMDFYDFLVYRFRPYGMKYRETCTECV